ncbi:MAG: hypothetical protein ACNA8R_08610 [Nitriliruptoraceae bacterium]
MTDLAGSGHGPERQATVSPEPAAAARDVPAAAASLAAKLGEFAGALPEDERRRLAAVLLSAMDPVSRRRWEPSSDLGVDQAAYLDRLVNRRRPDVTKREE